MVRWWWGWVVVALLISGTALAFDVTRNPSGKPDWVRSGGPWTANQCLVTDGANTATFTTCPGGGSGTVTSVATGAGLTGGPITTTGTVAFKYTDTLAGNPALGAGECVFDSTERGLLCEGATANTNEILLAFPDPGSDITVTLFNATDTVVGKATTDTLTNKTIDTAGTGNHIQIAGTDVTATSPAASGALVGTGRTLTAGAGLSGGGDLSANRTFATDSTEADFLASGALTCGASTQGKMKVHTTPLQYCDNAGTPTLQYAAYGDSSGNATNVACTNCISLTGEVTGTLGIGNGGTGQTSQTAAFNALDPLTTKGDVIAHDGTDSVRLAVGSNGQVLTADSSAAAGVKWAAQSVGIVNLLDDASTSASGANVSILGSNAIDTLATGSTLAISWDPTELANFTFFDGTAASRVITFAVTGTDPVITASAGTLAVTGSVSATGNLSASGDVIASNQVSASSVSTGTLLASTTVTATTNLIGAKIGIGTSTIPEGGVGMAKLAVEGTNASTAGPHMQFTTATDDRPVFSIYPWAHGDMRLLFDAYFDGTNYKSSTSHGNYGFISDPITDSLALNWAWNVTAGNTITWKDAFVLTHTDITFNSGQNTFNFAVNGSSLNDVLKVSASTDQTSVGRNGVSFTDSDTNPTCSAGKYLIYSDTSEAKLKKCQNGTASDLAAMHLYEGLTDKGENNSLTFTSGNFTVTSGVVALSTNVSLLGQQIEKSEADATFVNNDQANTYTGGYTQTFDGKLVQAFSNASTSGGTATSLTMTDTSTGAGQTTTGLTVLSNGGGSATVPIIRGALITADASTSTNGFGQTGLAVVSTKTGSGTSGTMQGVTVTLSNENASGLITTGNAITVPNGTNSGGGFTNYVGLKIADLTRGTNNWSLQVGNAQSYHVGNLRLGDTTAPTALLDVAGKLTVASTGQLVDTFSNTGTGGSTAASITQTDTGTGTAQTTTGLTVLSNGGGSATLPILRGALITVDSSTSTNGFGQTGLAVISTKTGSGTNATVQGITSTVSNENASGLITTGQAINIANGTNTGGGFTNYIGLTIGNLSLGTNNWSMQVGNAQSYHVGKLHLGATAAPNARAEITEATIGNEVLRVESTATNDDPADRWYHSRATAAASSTTNIDFDLTAGTPARCPSSAVCTVKALTRCHCTSGSSCTAHDGGANESEMVVKNVSGTISLVGAVQTPMASQISGSSLTSLTLSVSSPNARMAVVVPANFAHTCHVTWMLSNVGT